MGSPRLLPPVLVPGAGLPRAACAAVLPLPALRLLLFLGLLGLGTGNFLLNLPLLLVHLEHPVRTRRLEVEPGALAATNDQQTPKLGVEEFDEDVVGLPEDGHPEQLRDRVRVVQVGVKLEKLADARWEAARTRRIRHHLLPQGAITRGRHQLDVVVGVLIPLAVRPRPHAHDHLGHLRLEPLCPVAWHNTCPMSAIVQCSSSCL